MGIASNVPFSLYRMEPVKWPAVAWNKWQKVGWHRLCSTSDHVKWFPVGLMARIEKQTWKIYPDLPKVSKACHLKVGVFISTVTVFLSRQLKHNSFLIAIGFGEIQCV